MYVMLYSFQKNFFILWIFYLIAQIQFHLLLGFEFKFPCYFSSAWVDFSIWKFRRVHCNVADDSQWNLIEQCKPDGLWFLISGNNLKPSAFYFVTTNCFTLGILVDFVPPDYDAFISSGKCLFPVDRSFNHFYVSTNISQESKKNMTGFLNFFYFLQSQGVLF